MGNSLVRPAGLTTAWWQVLGALGYAPTPLTVSDIARAMGLTRQGVQRVVDLLAAHGHVAFTPNPHHQRAKLVAITEPGVPRSRLPNRRRDRSISGSWSASAPTGWRLRSPFSAN